MENATNNTDKKKGVKRKLPMELVQNEDYRKVCFTKRRQGLFKKAEELSVLCGANVRILAFSPAGNPYFYRSPCGSASTLDQFFPSTQQVVGNESDLERQASELHAKLEASKRKNESLKAVCNSTEESVWRADLANANLARLEKQKENLEQIRVASLSHVDCSSNKLESVVPDMGVGTSTVPGTGVATGTVVSHPAPYHAIDSEDALLACRGHNCS